LKIKKLVQLFHKGDYMFKELFDNTEIKMKKTIEHLLQELSIISTGRASANLLDSVKVDYYGSIVPINNLAHVSAPDPQSIVVQAFDPGSLELIEKSIQNSDLGFTPNNDGNIIRINIPALTEERRNEMVKIVHKVAEENRISIRNARRDANDSIKKQQASDGVSEDEVKIWLHNTQELTDKFIKEINDIASNKEKEILI
tara:strand:+ start:507 stop:1106 length:600 start_codon:yes stop_codon:yes gene_type:complete